MEDERKDTGLADQQISVSDNVPVSEISVDAEKIEKKDKKRKFKKLNKKFLAILIAAVIVTVLYSGYTHGKFDKALGKDNVAKIDKALGRATMTKEEAKDFINKNFMQGSTGAEVSEVTTENGLFKIKLTVAEQEYTAYLTKDKALFFPQAIVVADIQKQKDEADAQAKTDAATAQTEKDNQLKTMAKNDKPVVELFVMSHCPYGTQMEKGIIPVLKTLGNKIDFKLKFCDYMMHNDTATNNTKELTEQINQYCISQNQPDKLISYLECFLNDEASGGKCMTQVGIDQAKLSTCVAATDSKYKITAGLADKSTWKSGQYPAFPIFQADVDKYQVAGSPTLVVNGGVVSSNRDSQSILSTVCNGFTTAPAECSTALSTTTPAAGFGGGAAASGASSDASCGS